MCQQISVLQYIILLSLSIWATLSIGFANADSDIESIHIDAPKGATGTLTNKTAILLIKDIVARGLAELTLNTDCAEAKEAESGFFSTQVFIISDSRHCNHPPKALHFKNRYVLKGLKNPKKEINNLSQLKKSHLIKNTNYKNFPKIITGKLAISYNSHGKTYHFLLLDIAQGKQLSDIIAISEKILKKSQNNRKTVKYIKSLKDISIAYYHVGKKLANYHILFMEKGNDKLLRNTAIHGDLHYKNVFFDKRSEIVTFIDTETMANSINNTYDPGLDLTRIFFFSAAAIDIIPRLRIRFKSIAPNIPIKTLVQVTLKPFLKGYIEQFPEKKRKGLKKEIKKKLNTSALTLFFKSLQLTPHPYDPIRLYQIQNTYVNPVIDNL